jgi:outer membrane biogenesis lipoprotein LolB
MMGRRKTALVLAAVLLAGCATVQNTPEQERTWAAWEACKAAGRVTHWQIERVDPDGTIRW